MLTARALSKRYGAQLALDALELQVPAGEVFCLLGPNGAGKTTTLSLFLGFTAPSAGEAFVGDVCVARDPRAARARIAYVPEQVRLYPHLSGRENLEYFLRLSHSRVPSRAELARHLIDAGIPEAAIDRSADGYSKGMRQKVVLALAQARNAQVLLLDEPSSGLDPSAAEELYASVRRQSERGAAVLMVTHDLTSVVSSAHRLGIMRAGRLVHVCAAQGLGETGVQALYRQHFAA
ncbi:MAG TPA: ABC transporter ATP-binding protein [Polyangiales bacterium]|nr:ABC transporter ATP-binding protein [Polyangiales bacterium]